MGFRANAPASNLGYFRATDWPVNGGSGNPVRSGPTTAPGMNGAATSGAWHPTIVWLLGFIVAELVVFHALSKFLRL